MGGYLSVNHVITSYFAEEVTKEEARLLQVRIGESAAQQAFEAFAVLIALRLWSSQWKGSRICLRVRSDSMTALNMALKLKSQGTCGILIAQEA